MGKRLRNACGKLGLVPHLPYVAVTQKIRFASDISHITRCKVDELIGDMEGQI